MEILPKNLAYPTDGRVRTVTTFISCRPRFCGPSRSACSSPWRGYFPGREASLGRRTGRGAARRRAVLMREFSGRARRYRLRAFAQPELDPAKGRFAHGVLLAELRRADPTPPASVAQDVAVDAHARSGARRSRDADATRRRSLGLGGPREASRQLMARAHKSSRPVRFRANRTLSRHRRMTESDPFRTKTGNPNPCHAQLFEGLK